VPQPSALATEEIEYIPKVEPIRLAWGVLLISFGVFCTICIASVLLGHFFFFQSSVSFDMTLTVGKGTVRVKVGSEREQAESRFRDLISETTISTDSTDLWSQATINFVDPNYEQLVVSLSLKGNTTVRIEDATRPRFNWTSSDYQISLVDLTGEIDVLVSSELNRDISVSLMTPSGIELRLLNAGRYLVDASLSEVSITNRGGQAVIIAKDRITAESVGEGEKATILGEELTITRTPAPIELLENSDLDTLIPYQDGSAQIINDPPFSWTCTNGPANNLPRGNYYHDIAPDGRASFHLKRLNGATSNGYTRCSQVFPNGLDVTQYDYLALQAVLYINYQSLTGCGVEASECPLMLYVDYTDVNGVSGRRWFHGVYAQPLPSSSSWKRLCDDCVQEHILIYEKTWYIYNSGNWLNLFVADRRPAKINSISFYSEGHEYDVFVDEVAILARSTGTEQP